MEIWRQKGTGRTWLQCRRATLRMPAEEPSLPEPLASSAAAFEAALPLWCIASSSTLRFLLKRGTLS